MSCKLLASSGKYCYGKTPYQTFLESKHIAIEKTIDENSKINDDKKEISDSLNLLSEII